MKIVSLATLIGPLLVTKLRMVLEEICMLLRA